MRHVKFYCLVEHAEPLYQNENSLLTLLSYRILHISSEYIPYYLPYSCCHNRSRFEFLALSAFAYTI